MFESAACVRTPVRYPSPMTRTRVRPRVRRRRLAVALTLTLVASAWAGPLARAVSRPPSRELVATSTYVVEPGDSLWSIAKELAPGADPRPVVDVLAEANDASDGHLVPGEVLVVPGT